jgi:hypothetical protein
LTAAYLGGRDKHAATADAVMEHIRGCEAAKALIHRVRDGVALPDELLDALIRQKWQQPWLRGFARELQKALEHGACAS